MNVFERLDVRLGADPELFLVDAGGKFVSAIGLIGGTKQEPRALPREGCALQEDNVAVEFNIPACRTLDELQDNIKYVLDTITKEVNGLGLYTSIVPSAVFTEDELNHPLAFTAGCETDWNAWTQKPNDKPDVSLDALRTSGGHVHVSYNLSKLKVAPYIMVRACDIFLGSYLSQIDTDTERRRLYGSAGAHRTKAYGFEYRVPSNIWIRDASGVQMVYEQMEKVFLYMEEHPLEDFQAVEALVCGAVNHGNMEAFDTLNAKYHIVG